MSGFRQQVEGKVDEARPDAESLVMMYMRDQRVGASEMIDTLCEFIDGLHHSLPEKLMEYLASKGWDPER